MNAAQQAYGAFSDATSGVKSPSQIEYQAFARVTQALSRTAAPEKATAKDGGFARLASALHDNLRLWTIVARDVAGGGNALPDGLRSQLFYLSEFTRHHTALVLKGEAEAEPLIEINTAIMRGLRQQGEAASCQG